MENNYITDVIRKNGFAILVETTWEGRRAIFFKEKEILRRGLRIPDFVFGQVRAIFAENKKKKPIKAPTNLRPISKTNLKKEELNRLAILAKYGIKYLTQGWLSIDYRLRNQDVFLLVPRHVRDIHTAIRMQNHICSAQGPDEHRLGIVEAATARRQLLLKERLIMEDQARRLRWFLKFSQEHPDSLNEIMPQALYLAKILWPSPFYEIAQKRISLLRKIKISALKK